MIDISTDFAILPDDGERRQPSTESHNRRRGDYHAPEGDTDGHTSLEVVFLDGQGREHLTVTHTTLGVSEVGKLEHKLLPALETHYRDLGFTVQSAFLQIGTRRQAL